MPKISTPKPDYTEKQFTAALRRNAFCEQAPSMFHGRRFRIFIHAKPDDVGVIRTIENVPAIYEGTRLSAKINLRLTLKHLQSIAALEMHRVSLAGAKAAPEPTQIEEAARRADGHDPDFFPTQAKA